MTAAAATGWSPARSSSSSRPGSRSSPPAERCCRSHRSSPKARSTPTTIGVGIAIGAFAIGSLLLRPVVGWGSTGSAGGRCCVFGTLLSVAALALHSSSTRCRCSSLARAMLGAAEAFFFVACWPPRATLHPGSTRGGVQPCLACALHRAGTRAADRRDGPRLVGYDEVWIVAAGLTAVAAVLSLRSRDGASRPCGRVRRDEASPGPAVPPGRVFPGVVVLLGTWGMAGYFAFVPLHAKQIGMSGSGGALDGLRRAGRRPAGGLREAAGPDGRGPPVRARRWSSPRSA